MQFFLKEVLIMTTKPKHSGFEAPLYGTLLPKGTKLKKNADGTVTPVYPKKSSKTKGGNKPK